MGDVKLFKTSFCGGWRGTRESSRKPDKHRMQLAVSAAQTFSSGTPPSFFFLAVRAGHLVSAQNPEQDRISLTKVLQSAMKQVKKIIIISCSGLSYRRAHVNSCLLLFMPFL